MAKHKVRKAGVKRARRSSPMTRAPKKAPNRIPYPSEELKALFTVTGKATIQEVHFDLDPVELAQRGFLPWPWATAQHTNPFYDSSLSFPWDSEPEENVVRAGDEVRVGHITRHTEGDELDHESDQSSRMVEYAVYRNGEKLDIDIGPTEYFSADTFLVLLDFKTAVARIRRLVGDKASLNIASMVGDTATDPLEYQLRNGESSKAVRDQMTGARGTLSQNALEAAFGVNAIWACIVQSHRSDNSQRQSEETRNAESLCAKSGHSIATGGTNSPPTRTIP